MNKKTWDVLRILLGGYLIWVGISLLIQVTKEKPSDMSLMSVLAVIFVFTGLGYAVYHLDKMFNLKRYLKVFRILKRRKKEEKLDADAGKIYSERQTAENVKREFRVVPLSDSVKTAEEEQKKEISEQTKDANDTAETETSTESDSAHDAPDLNEEQETEKREKTAAEDIKEETEEKIAEKDVTEEIENDYEEK